MMHDGDHTTVGAPATETVPPAPLIVTTDVTLADHIVDLVTVLQRAGLGVERRTFQPTPPEEEPARRIVLLAQAGPLPVLVALVAPPTAPAAVGPALSAALFPQLEAAEPATLQLKASGVFVSIVAADAAELREALIDLAECLSMRTTPWRVAPEQEQRLVYAEGRWDHFAR